MCGRFTLGRWERRLLAEELGVPEESLPGLRPRYNIAPTDEHLIVRSRFEERQALVARWGLVNSWAKDARRAGSQINARAEQIERRPAFREAFLRRRCIVPADGFYEWTGPREQRRPFWFHRPGGRLLLFAGVYESWQRAPGAWERTFAIITTDANGDVAPFHDRMPVILDAPLADHWLDSRPVEAAELRRVLVPPPPGTLAARPVSPAVNSVRNDYPELLEAQPALL